MKVPKEARKIARALFRSSFADGRLDEAKARQVMQQVVVAKPRHLPAILKTYERFVRLELQRSQARVESAVELGDDLRQQIARQLEQVYRRPIAAEFRVNSELIGGVRIRVGSDVWDGSVAQRLRELSATM